MGATADLVIRVGGIELGCTDTGGPGRPLLLVHGFTGSRDDWADVVEPLRERTGRVITFDLRGHGDSTNVGRRESYDLSLLVEDLLALLEALDITECDAIGHSLGGLLLVEAYVQAPERFASLLLISTPARPTATNISGLLDGRSMIERLGAMRFAVNMGLTNALALVGGMRMLTPFFVRSARVGPPAMQASRLAMGPDVFDERTRVKVRAMDAHAFVHIGDLLTRFPSIEDDLRLVKCPTMVMVGEQDREFLPLAQEVCDALAGSGTPSSLVRVPLAAHCPQVENREAWLDIVEAHVREVRDPTAADRREA